MENNFEFRLEGNGHSATGIKVKLNGVELTGVWAIEPFELPTKDDSVAKITITFRADTVKIINKFAGVEETYGK